VTERDREHVLEQLGQVQDLHAVVPQYLREDVVLLLGARGPGQAGEEQLPGMTRQHAFQLGSRPVHDNRPGACPPHCPPR
jgi:hypothetical protein